MRAQVACDAGDAAGAVDDHINVEEPRTDRLAGNLIGSGHREPRA